MSRFINRILTSPVPVVLFLLLPALELVFWLLEIPRLNPDDLAANNVIFGAYMAIRLVYYLIRLNVDVRYGRDARRFRGSEVATPSGGPEVREALEKDGYVFDESGTYAEKKDLGYWGAIALCAGLAVVLAFWAYDDLRRLSGSMLYAKGTINMWSRGAYRSLDEGRYSDIDRMGKLRIVTRIFPSDEWPRGAIEIALLDREGNELERGLVGPGRPIRHGDIEVRVPRQIYDAWVVVQTVENLIVLNKWVRLEPMDESMDGYTHYGEISGKYTVNAWLSPGKKTDRLKVQVRDKDEKLVDLVLTRPGGHIKVAGGYRTKLEGLGKWIDFRIERKRHVAAIIMGAVLALAGAVLRLTRRPMRIRLEERDGRTYAVAGR
jgi:hypothetical protein